MMSYYRDISRCPRLTNTLLSAIPKEFQEMEQGTSQVKNNNFEEEVRVQCLVRSFWSPDSIVAEALCMLEWSNAPPRMRLSGRGCGPKSADTGSIFWSIYR